MDEAILNQIAETADYRHVARGEVLIREGEAAEELFIVLKGRFVVLVGENPIAEITVGEPIGELAFFAGGTRTASVIAARNSTVMAFSRQDYDMLAAQAPEISKGILKALSQRLANTIVRRPDVRPRAAKVCSVIPGGASPIAPGFTEQLKCAFAKVEGWRVVDEADSPESARNDEAALTAWLDEQEKSGVNMVLLCTEPLGHETWRKVIVENSDSVMIALEKTPGQGDPVPTSEWEADVLQATLKPNVQLALYRSEKSQPTSDTARWLVHRDVSLHHHVGLDAQEDFDRLARFIRGEALGLVLCGGGSFGTAHLGVILALQERGYKFDFIGGTSVGAAMAGALALDIPPRGILDVCEDLFIRSKAMSRLTVPKHSVLDHTRLDGALKHHFGDTNIEDMPINFFAIATSLTHNDECVMRTGLLWQAVRASTALPGALPPFIREDGEVLIDGGLLNNVPITVMRDFKSGPNLVLNFLAPKPWRARSKYEDFPTRGQAVAGLLKFGKGKGPRKPNMFSILSRTMVVNSRRLLQHTDMGPDVLMNISTLRGMGFMNWKRGRELFDVAYGRMVHALDEVGNETHGVERLRAASDVINALESE